MLYTIHGRLSQTDRYEYIQFMYTHCVHEYDVDFLAIYAVTIYAMMLHNLLTPPTPPKNNVMQILSIEKKMR